MTNRKMSYMISMKDESQRCFHLQYLNRDASAVVVLRLKGMCLSQVNYIQNCCQANNVKRCPPCNESDQVSEIYGGIFMSKNQNNTNLSGHENNCFSSSSAVSILLNNEAQLSSRICFFSLILSNNHIYYTSIVIAQNIYLTISKIIPDYFDYNPYICPDLHVDVRHMMQILHLALFYHISRT